MPERDYRLHIVWNAAKQELPLLLAATTEILSRFQSP